MHGSCRSALTNDIRALYNHNHDIVLGRKSNNTLVVTEDTTGIFGTIIINKDDTEAVNIYERVKRGDINGCSFGGWFNEMSQEAYNGGLIDNIRSVDVLEISICVFPQYEQTEIQARHINSMDLQKKQLNELKKEAKERFANGIKNN